MNTTSTFRKRHPAQRQCADNSGPHITAHILKLCVSFSAFCILLCSCSPTKHLDEGETLYTGIKEIAYGHKAQAVIEAQKADTTGHGVITDVANAVAGITSLLEGKSLNSDYIESELKRMEEEAKDKSLSRSQRDSLKSEKELVEQALAQARTEVDAVLACPPTGSLFGSSSMHLPSSPSVMFYNLTANSTSRFGKWLRTSFAKEPVTIKAVNPRTRALVARNTLRAYGFFDGDVEYDILNDAKPQRAHIAYSVYPRRLYRIDSIEYRGFPLLMDSLLRRSMNSTHLHSGAAFCVTDLDAERNRISKLMRNRGYYNFAATNITFLADTLQHKGHVQLRVQPTGTADGNTLRRYYIGDTDITLLQYDNYTVVDSIPNGKRPATRKLLTKRRKPQANRQERLNIKMRYSGKPGQPPLRLAALRKQLFYRRGMPYNHDLMEIVASQMSSMGLFSQLQMSYEPQDSTPGCDTLRVRISAVLDKPYDSEFEARLTSKSNGQVGPGAAYSLSKRNAFRRGEKVTFKVYGSYEWQTGARPADAPTSAINSYEMGTSLLLDYPRLIMPRGRTLSQKAFTSTAFKLDGSWLNRAGYFSMVEVSGDATYSFRKKMNSKHLFTPLKLKYTSLLSTTGAFDEVASRTPALYVSMRDQFVPSMEYTYSLTSRRRAANPWAVTIVAKEAGNVTSGVYAAFGHRFKERDKELLGVPFAQFAKLTADLRKEYRLTPRQSLVGHVAAGVVYSYGNSSSAPYSDLFCVGGANSIRAFCLRGVGPGRYNPSMSGYSYLDQMGDMKLEANVEYRFPIIQSLYGAVFADCGNVWLMKPDAARSGGQFEISSLGRDLALGTGAGLRYDLDFLVIRFDIGVGLHAPYDTGKSGYYNMPRFGKSLGYHLAIGYPF